ncbi:MAG: hypothetical protein HY329_04140 [Chloroflexi bacterium]|nr:hypothetical protein [Chloroflexota bacterium]
MADLARFLDKQYEQMDFDQLAQAPVAALAGVSEGDAKLLEQAFKVRTIGDLANNKYFLAAQAICALSQSAKK